MVRLAAASPGNPQELLDLVSELHAAPLDRNRPLWRIFVIDGLADGRIATYCKMHHALADGVAGTRLLLRSLSEDAMSSPPPGWAIPAPVRTDEKAGDTRRRAAGALVDALAGIPTAIAGVLRTRRELREARPDTIRGNQAPASILNQPIGATRAVAAQSYRLDRVRTLCGVFDGSTNAMMLALFSSALRRYLQHDCGVLPAAPLIAMVPMSTRVDDTAAGNEVVPLLVNLCADRPDPLERMRATFSCYAHALNRVHEWSPAAIYGYSLLTAATGVFNLLARPSGGALPFNVVISKLTGPRTATYWQGCRLDALYPISIVMRGQALNLRYAIRHDTIDVGLVACPQRLPHADRLLTYVAEAIEELETQARRITARPAPRAAVVPSGGHGRPPARRGWKAGRGPAALAGQFAQTNDHRRGS